MTFPVAVSDVIERIYEARLADEAHVLVYLPQCIRSFEWDDGERFPDLIEAPHGYGEDSYVMLHVSDPDASPRTEPYTVADVRRIIDEAELDGDAWLRIKLDEAMLDHCEPNGGWYVTRTAGGLPEDGDVPVLKLLVDNGRMET